MESIGKYLREAREQRGLTLDQVARETNISRQFISALEEDQYDVFPAEPYIVGFLRNYSDHLGLDTEALVGKYRTQKIQEQPAPLEELIRKPSPWPLRILWGAGAVVVLAILVIFVIPPVIGLVSSIPAALASSTPDRAPKSYSVAADTKTWSQRLYVGDTVQVAVGDQSIALSLASIGDETVLGSYRLTLGDEVYLDLNQDGVQDVRLFLKDVSPSDPNRGAEFALERVAAAPQTLQNGPGALGDEMKPGLPEAGTVTLASVEQKPVIILTDVPAKPFTIDVVFRGYALFRYVVDDNRREENYFRKGDAIRIEASRKVQIWVSNAGAFSGKANSSTDFEIGRPGEVSARTIEWSKDSSGKTILVANPLN